MFPELAKPTLARVVALAALVVLAVGLVFPLRARLLPPDDVLPGLTVDGAVPPPGSELHAFVAERAKALLERRVKIVLDGKDLGDASLGELGVVVDEPHVVALAASLGHEGDLVERATLAQRARRGQLDVPLSPRIDTEVAMAMLARIKDAEDVAPISARLDLDRHGVVPARDGRYVDADAALAALTRLVSDPNGAVLDLPHVGFPARMSSEFVRSIDVHVVLSSYDTYFSRRGDQARRGQNIDVAASKLDGLVLSPGELVSFNQVVGERSEENGFQKSWEIFKGEMKEGVGGGTCQVASTLHAASFFAGIEILERLPHSRPSAYIPMGLDATVVYPVVDMKLRNPHKFPIVVHAKVDGNRLHVEMLGAAKPVHVEFSRELVKTFPYPRKIEEKSALARKKVIVKQHGIRGYRIKRERIMTFAGGKKRIETNNDFYPPTTEIYEVPRGFDVSLLPPLPADDEDDGEGSDTSAAAASAAAAVTPAPPPGWVPPYVGAPPPVPATTSTVGAAACPTGDCPMPSASVADLHFEDAPGAHAPTTAQTKPEKTMKIRR